MPRGAPASLLSREGIGELVTTRRKSWAELRTFFERERALSTGRDYKRNPSKQLDEYRGWVYSAVDCIVDRLCSLSYTFKREDTGEVISPFDKRYHAILKPIIKPNEYMSLKFLMQFCQTQLDLCGKAAILKVRNAFGKPWELWPLDMNDFRRIVYPHRRQAGRIVPPVGFEFRLGNKLVLIEWKDIIWLRYPSPLNMWDGFSPIRAQAYTTDIDYYLEVYERGFFRNSARVDFVIEGENLTEEDAKRLKQEWVKKYGGPKRSYEPAVLTGGIKIVPITMTNKDFQFLELARWTKERILSAYRVPEGKLGLFRDINRANQKGIDIAFNEGAILPRARLWESELTYQLIWADFTEKVSIEFENPIPRDREADLKELQLRSGKGMVPINTINELRNWWDGSPSIAGGDAILVNQNLVPITSVVGENGEGDTESGNEKPPVTDDDDKPGQTDDDPEYDPEYDPGGEESDKKILDWEKALAPLVGKYREAISKTKGWSVAKVENYLRGLELDVSDGVKRIFENCVLKDYPEVKFKQAVKAYLILTAVRRKN